MKIKKIKVNEIVGTAVTVLIAVLILFPLIWLLVSSFKSDADVIKWPPIFFPTQWLTAQYKYVVDAIPILSMLKNTVVFSVGVTVLITISGFMNVCQEKPQDFPFFHGKPCEKRETQDYSRYRDLAWKCFLPGFPLPEK